MSDQTSQQLDLQKTGQARSDQFHRLEEHPLLLVSSVYQLIRDFQPALLKSRRQKQHVFDMIYRYLEDRKKHCYEKLLQDELNEELFEMIKELRLFKEDYKVKKTEDLDIVFDRLLDSSMKRAGICSY